MFCSATMSVRQLLALAKSVSNHHHDEEITLDIDEYALDHNKGKEGAFVRIGSASGDELHCELEVKEVHFRMS